MQHLRCCNTCHNVFDWKRWIFVFFCTKNVGRSNDNTDSMTDTYHCKYMWLEALVKLQCSDIYLIFGRFICSLVQGIQLAKNGISHQSKFCFFQQNVNYSVSIQFMFVAQLTLSHLQKGSVKFLKSLLQTNCDWEYIY